MRFQRIIEQVYFRNWYITAAAHHSIDRLVSSKLADRVADGSGLDEFVSQFVNKREPMVIDRDGIATIHVLGPVARGLAPIEKSCGATDLGDLVDDYDAAIAGGARGILLKIDSPGGSVIGTPEAAAKIATRAVPTVAHTADWLCSAAYYIAAGANRIVATGSSAVGSIGVYCPWVDYADKMEQEGLKPNPVVNTGGDLKAFGFTGVLTDAQRADAQRSVDSDFAKFSAHVRAFRDIPDEAMRGQYLSGTDALDANLIDEIGSLSDARASLLKLL